MTLQTWSVLFISADLERPANMWGKLVPDRTLDLSQPSADGFSPSEPLPQLFRITSYFLAHDHWSTSLIPSIRIIPGILELHQRKNQDLAIGNRPLVGRNSTSMYNDGTRSGSTLTECKSSQPSRRSRRQETLFYCLGVGRLRGSRSAGRLIWAVSSGRRGHKRGKF